MPGIVEGPLSMPWHFARFVSQVSVLSVLLTLAEVGSEAEDEAARALPKGAPRIKSLVPGLELVRDDED